MITERLSQMLVAQIQSELSAHQKYMGISIYFERRSLKRWAELFKKQSLEEAAHAMKILQFLVDQDVVFDLPALSGASTQYPHTTAAVEAALASERKVSGEFRAMAQAANEEGDWTVFQFLQWFIEEQVEEESKMGDLLNLLASGVNDFEAEALLDRFDGE